VQIDAPGKPKLHGVVHHSEPGYDTYIEKPGYGRDADPCFAERNRHS
jgi:deglycase